VVRYGSLALLERALRIQRRTNAVLGGRLLRRQLLRSQVERSGLLRMVVGRKNAALLKFLPVTTFRTLVLTAYFNRLSAVTKNLCHATLLPNDETTQFSRPDRLHRTNADARAPCGARRGRQCDDEFPYRHVELPRDCARARSAEPGHIRLDLRSSLARHDGSGAAVRSVPQDDVYHGSAIRVRFQQSQVDRINHRQQRLLWPKFRDAVAKRPLVTRDVMNKDNQLTQDVLVRVNDRKTADTFTGINFRMKPDTITCEKTSS